MRVTLRPVKRTDYRFLYRLLSSRNPCENISHRCMPTYKEHCKFNDTKRYLADFVILDGKKQVGRIYISFLNEIGVHLLPGNDFDYARLAIESVMEDGEKYYFNVSPGNEPLNKYLTQKGYRVIQKTYESLS